MSHSRLVATSDPDIICAAIDRVEPFRREDCCLISDGGGAFNMTTPEGAVEVAGVGTGNSYTGTHCEQQAALRPHRKCSPRPRRSRWPG